MAPETLILMPKKAAAIKGEKFPGAAGFFKFYKAHCPGTIKALGSVD